MKIFRRLILLAAMVAIAIGAQAQLPSVQLKTLDGQTVNAAELNNDGKPFVISFFATWCKPCNRELKAIHEYYPDWQDETGMRLIAISIDEAQNASKVKPMVDAEGWEYQILLDSNKELMRTLGIQEIPHVLIIDGQGNIVDSRSGYTDGSEEHIIEKVRELVD